MLESSSSFVKLFFFIVLVSSFFSPLVRDPLVFHDDFLFLLFL